MPFGNAQSLTNDELYAITAYVLYLNDVIKDENFELNEKNFTSIKLPNQPNFIDDDREVAEKEFWRKTPCMANCVPGEAKIIGRARALDVTPETGNGTEGRVAAHAHARSDQSCSGRARRAALAASRPCPRRGGQGARRVPVVRMRDLPSDHAATTKAFRRSSAGPTRSSSRSWTNIGRRSGQSDHADDRRPAVGRGDRRACGVFRKPAACELSNNETANREEKT